MDDLSSTRDAAAETAALAPAGRGDTSELVTIGAGLAGLTAARDVLAAGCESLAQLNYQLIPHFAACRYQRHQGVRHGARETRISVGSQILSTPVSRIENRQKETVAILSGAVCQSKGPVFWADDNPPQDLLSGVMAFVRGARSDPTMTPMALGMSARCHDGM